MSSKLIDRAFGIIELLSQYPLGLGVTEISEALDLPKGSTHRLLSDLIDLEYIKLIEPFKLYQLTLKLAQLSFHSLASSSVINIAQPLLANLAKESKQLVRLSLVDRNRLIFISKEQGAKSGLRVDPDMGKEARLGFSAAGLAWLSTLDNNSALDMVLQQQARLNDEIDSRDLSHDHEKFFIALQNVREKKHSRFQNTMGEGTSAMATPILYSNQSCAFGVISIAGPSIYLTEEKMDELVQPILEVATILSDLSSGLPLIA